MCFYFKNVLTSFSLWHGLHFHFPFFRCFHCSIKWTCFVAKQDQPLVFLLYLYGLVCWFMYYTYEMYRMNDVSNIHWLEDWGTQNVKMFDKKLKRKKQNPKVLFRKFLYSMKNKAFFCFSFHIRCSSMVCNKVLDFDSHFGNDANLSLFELCRIQYLLHTYVRCFKCTTYWNGCNKNNNPIYLDVTWFADDHQVEQY